jgi:hypothetical protein
MGRSRSRRRCDSSTSSSSSDSEDSEEERREEERRAAKAARRAQRKADAEERQAEAERQKKQVTAERITASIRYAIKDEINSYEEADDELDEMANTTEFLARKPVSAPDGVKDMSEWAAAEQYLREHFGVHASVEKVALVVQYFDPRDNTAPKL